jgi:hypothetical protein
MQAMSHCLIARNRSSSPTWRAAIACLAAGLCLTAAAQAAVVIPVLCDDVTVGEIAVSVSLSGRGVRGQFTANTTLAEAAEICGEDHFNWFQAVGSDNHPPDGLVPPYMDPPHGGYSDQWADNLDWYWDEQIPAEDPGNFEPGFSLTEQTTEDTLFFEDFPAGEAGTELTFAIWLVSLNPDGSLHEFHDGFTWTWSNDETNIDGTADLGAEMPASVGGQLYQSLVPEPSCLVWIGLAILVTGRKRGDGRLQ